MSRRKLTDVERKERSDARWQIIQAANRWKLRVRYQPRLFGMRDLHAAVFMCRQHQLVKPGGRQHAGFRAKPDLSGLRAVVAKLKAALP